MTVETEPMNLPPGEPVVDLDAYKVPEQDVPPRESPFRSARRSRSTPKAAKPKERVPASKPGEFVEPLTQMYTMMGIGVSMMDARAGHDDHNCGPIIVENATKIATSWDELAQKNDQVRKALRTMTQGSAWAGVIGAHVPIALAIFSQHAPGSTGSMSNSNSRPDAGVSESNTTDGTDPGPVAPAPVKKVPGRQYKRPPVKKAVANG